jgi:hypothetical protein
VEDACGFAVLVTTDETDMPPRVPFAVVVLLAGAIVPVQGDTFVIRLDDGRDVRVEARHAGSGQNAHALELANGRLQLIPAERLRLREPGPDPTPMTCEELLADLTDEFGSDRVVSQIEKPFVIVYVRGANGPSEPLVERRLATVVKRAATFFRGMQNSFLEFVRQARVETTPVRYPLVVLIFEQDTQFDAHVASITQGQGASIVNIAALYDLMSNRLVIRLRECATFDTPLHEAVHQQAYNRGLFQRLAPVPAWFNEGLANSFEGDGERIRGGPRMVSDRYGPVAFQALRGGRLNWRDIVANDRPFHDDGLAGDAYSHAWGLHWLLVTRHRSAYNKLVRHYAAKQPLQVDRPDQRLAEFEELVGKSVQELQADFQQEFPKLLAARKKR